MPRSYITDPHSRSRPNEVVVRHIALDLDVDFTAHRLSGSAAFDLEHRAADATQLVLDTWQLDVTAVRAADGSDLAFQVGEHDPVLGSALTVEVGTADRVVVHYATSPEARAMQWLDAELADGRQFLSGNRFTIADIAALTVIDFAALIGLDPIADNPAVTAWHARVSSRPSASS